MRVLLCVHHRLERDAGAPGATLELGRALEAAGCEVDYYGYEQAFRGLGGVNAYWKGNLLSRVISCQEKN